MKCDGGRMIQPPNDASGRSMPWRREVPMKGERQLLRKSSLLLFAVASISNEKVH